MTVFTAHKPAVEPVECPLANQTQHITLKITELVETDVFLFPSLEIIPSLRISFNVERFLADKIQCITCKATGLVETNVCQALSLVMVHA